MFSKKIEVLILVIMECNRNTVNQVVVSDTINVLILVIMECNRNLFEITPGLWEKLSFNPCYNGM